MSDSADDTPDGIPRPGDTGRTRVSRWDRPRLPKDWRYWVGGSGRVLMTIGLLMFGFVAYQLWGTSIEYRQHQSSLEREFERRQDALATSTTAPALPTTVGTTTPGGSPTSAPASPTSSPVTQAAAVVWPTIELGDVIAVIDIPKIGEKVYAVAGIRTQDLKQGLGHYPDTPLPGQFGNVAFAGHRTTYGAPLFEIDSLVAGDEIIITTLTGQRYVYRMVGQALVVSPHDYGVIRDSDPKKATLTLTSCHPRYSARKRIVVKAELDASLSGPVDVATPYYGQTIIPSAPDDGSPDDSVVTPDDESGPDASVAGPVDVVIDGQTFEGAGGLSRGWFSDSGALPQVALWGLILTALATGAYLLARRTRRIWVGIAVGFLPFFVMLYFFYQNVNRLLPPDL